ncbi:unnamed protein product [Bemisia tabaci]|uniref:Thioredoxin domain-containing protein n=1 Tax=Bemisia tabaci TaxID=7038 RepID=A0A9P0A7L4_BEMTA|nr:unnamed protein product [Bemisia tabaci]
MTLVMPSLDEDTDGDKDSRDTRGFNFFEKMMNLDREIILFAVLLTSYAAVRNMNQTASKNSEPKPFFAENPWLNDFYHGEIHKAFSLASKEDITFVMYYAPWDADCQRSRPIFEKVARYYHRQIHFMAINCWEPSSICKAHFSKIKRYPVFMVYFQRSKGVEYQGVVDFAHMTHFLSSVITPLQRIKDLQELNNLRATHDAVVIAYIPLYGMFGREHYNAYYHAALKFLEVDPRRDVAFAIVTDASSADNTVFHRSSQPPTIPVIKLFLWNTTLQFERKWDPSDIVKWIHESTHKIATWVYPPGVKSNLLAQFIESGPAVILFTPRNMFLSHTYEYNILKLAALHFYDCDSKQEKKDFYSTMYSLMFLISSDDQLDSLKALKYACSANTLQREPEIISKSRKLTSILEEHSVHRNLSHNNSFNYFQNDELNSYATSRSWQPYNMAFTEEYSSESLLRNKLKHDCRKLRFALKYLPEHWLNNDELHSAKKNSKISARGLGCQGNVTMSFLAMDSLHFENFAANLGVNLNDKYAKTGVFIVDSKSESVHFLNATYLSLESLEQFISNFSQGNLSRLLRSSEGSHSSETKSGNSLIETVTSKTFNHYVINTNKTVLVYFYSPYCTYSQSVYYIFVSLANTLKSLNEFISFVRIDGDNNDLEWPFMIDKYPSIIIFPSTDKTNSKLFNRKSKISISNLSKFILSNLNFELRAQVHILFCLNRMLSAFSVESCMINFKQYSVYFISYYNSQLRNILIHHKLQSDAFMNGTNRNSKSAKQNTNFFSSKNGGNKANQSLISSINKIRCKLMYIQLVSAYLNKVDFTNADLNLVSSNVLSFYQFYLKDDKEIPKYESSPCINLFHALKQLENNQVDKQETLKNFQNNVIQYTNTLKSVLCHMRESKASKCENLKHLHNVNKGNPVEHPDPITNDSPTTPVKDDETYSTENKNPDSGETASNEIVVPSSEDPQEKETFEGRAIVDEL